MTERSRASKAIQEIVAADHEAWLDKILREHRAAAAGQESGTNRHAATHDENDDEYDDERGELLGELRQRFLQIVRQDPTLLERTEVAHFLGQEIQPTDFDILQWESPEHILEFSEALFGVRFSTEEQSEQVRNHVAMLVRQALQQYEQQGKWEKLYLLMRIAPVSVMRQDPEVLRLRHLAHSYEIRRVRRNRWWLYTYLLLQVVLVIGIFPYLFINAENGAIQRQVEQLANVELGDEGYRLFSYFDGLYWSVITAGSIGYGDITPYTVIGKIMAGVLGTMGVITAGVIAGLVLKWITPRQLD